ncbi:MAG: hypothetical protein JSU73_02235 [candidate division WOR-3 bacterium]|nr:MAG: hypothetical protein JSU73_02235 [candidate division WOR-3 bacterium]
MPIHNDSRKAAYLAVFALVTVLSAPGLAETPGPGLVNGDFSAPWSTGWTSESRDFAGYHRFDNLPDGGVRVRKTMCGFARLAQEIELGNIDNEFSGKARFRALANRPGYHAYSALALGFLDEDGRLLGETRFYTISGQKGRPSTDLSHFVPVEPGNWVDLSLSIKEELRAHLTGVVPAKVKGLRVTLEAFGSGTATC